DPTLFQICHREFGHNLFAASGFVCLGAWLLRSLGLGTSSRWILSGLLVGSHLLLDSMCLVLPNHKFAGVPLFFPLDGREFVIPIGLFHGVSFQDGFWNVLRTPQFWMETAIR